MRQLITPKIPPISLLAMPKILSFQHLSLESRVLVPVEHTKSSTCVYSCNLHNLLLFPFYKLKKHQCSENKSPKVIYPVGDRARIMKTRSTLPPRLLLPPLYPADLQWVGFEKEPGEQSIGGSRIKFLKERRVEGRLEINMPHFTVLPLLVVD